MIDKLKTVALAGAALVVGGAAAYGAAYMTLTPSMVTVTRSACGVAANAPGGTISVPLRLVAAGPGVHLRYGPVEMPRGGGAVSFALDSSVDGSLREVRMVDDLLYLPTAFGRDKAFPREISFSCRDGAIASVRYVGEGRGGQTFNVVRETTPSVGDPVADAASAS